MRKTTKEEVTMKIGKMNISFKPYDANNILIALKSNARGFKTIFKFSNESAKNFYMFLCKNNTINGDFNYFIINDLKIKHREYTRTIEEDIFSMKYFNTNNGRIKVVCIDGCTVIRIEDAKSEKIYEHFCYDTNEFIYIINENKQKINLMMNEHMMNNWD